MNLWGSSLIQRTNSRYTLLWRILMSNLLNGVSSIYAQSNFCFSNSLQLISFSIPLGIICSVVSANDVQLNVSYQLIESIKSWIILQIANRLWKYEELDNSQAFLNFHAVFLLISSAWLHAVSNQIFYLSV